MPVKSLKNISTISFLPRLRCIWVNTHDFFLLPIGIGNGIGCSAGRAVPYADDIIGLINHILITLLHTAIGVCKSVILLHCLTNKMIFVVYTMGQIMKEIAKIVGERLRFYRNQKGFCQEELAEKAGLHNTYIGQLERGEKNATLESVEKVAKALDLPLEALFENIMSGNTKNETAKEGYELLSSLSEKEQTARQS